MVRLSSVPLRALVTTCALSILACGGLGQTDKKVPKPWVKREGQVEITGTTTGEESADRAAGLDVQPTNTQRIDATGPATDIPVDHDYAGLFAAAQITCPDGTELADAKATQLEQFCTLADGRRHGPFMKFHSGGKVKEIGAYVEGKRHGVVTAWDREGTRLSAHVWEQGSPTSGEIFQ